MHHSEDQNPIRGQAAQQRVGKPNLPVGRRQRDLARERDSRRTPSNPTRTCNTVADVYM